jgi:hypothetical protein
MYLKVTFKSNLLPPPLLRKVSLVQMLIIRARLRLPSMSLSRLKMQFSSKHSRLEIVAITLCIRKTRFSIESCESVVVVVGAKLKEEMEERETRAMGINSQPLIPLTPTKETQRESMDSLIPPSLKGV